MKLLIDVWAFLLTVLTLALSYLLLLIPIAVLYVSKDVNEIPTWLGFIVFIILPGISLYGIGESFAMIIKEKLRIGE